MGRSAPILPLHAGAPLAGHDQYVPSIPSDWRARAVRWWSYGGIVRSAQMPRGAHGHNGDMVKTLAGWGGATTTQEILDHAQEVRELTGCRCVSGYAGAVRAAMAENIFPVESFTHTEPYIGLLRGAWQEALQIGKFTGHYRQYDLKSAYYSSLLEGLPDPRTYRRTRIVGAHGLYRVILRAPVKGAPYPFNTETEVLATYEEIKAYALDVLGVVDGVRWQRDFNIKPIIEACDMWSFKNRARRCFWGHWGSKIAVTCHTQGGKSWEPLRARPHPVWAHLIMSRTRRKVWEASARAVHVYVDSVITTDILPTGTNAGDWVLARDYPAGVAVGGTGRYGSITEPLWDKFAGVPVGDARRTRA